MAKEGVSQATYKKRLGELIKLNQDVYDNFCQYPVVKCQLSAAFKKGRIKKHTCKNRKLAIEDVSNYIYIFHNPTRRH